MDTGVTEWLESFENHNQLIMMWPGAPRCVRDNHSLIDLYENLPTCEISSYLAWDPKHRAVHDRCIDVAMGATRAHLTWEEAPHRPDHDLIYSREWHERKTL